MSKTLAEIWGRYKWVIVVIGSVLVTLIVTSTASDTRAAKIKAESEKQLKEYRVQVDMLTSNIKYQVGIVEAKQIELDKKTISLGSLSAANKELLKLVDKPAVVRWIEVDKEKWVPKTSYEECYLALGGVQQEVYMTKESLTLCLSISESKDQIIKDQEARFTLCSEQVVALEKTRDKLARLASRKFTVAIGPFIGYRWDAVSKKPELSYGIGIVIGKKIW